MSQPTITTETLYELFKEFKTDINHRFDQIEENRRADRAEMRQLFQQMEENRRSDKAEMEVQRKADKAEMEKRFDQMEENRRADKAEILEAIRNEKREREKMEEKLDKVYESRDRISVSFTRAWATASFFIALIASTIVLAVEKAF